MSSCSTGCCGTRLTPRVQVPGEHPSGTYRGFRGSARRRHWRRYRQNAASIGDHRVRTIPHIGSFRTYLRSATAGTLSGAVSPDVTDLSDSLVTLVTGCMKGGCYLAWKICAPIDKPPQRAKTEFSSAA